MGKDMAFAQGHDPCLALVWAVAMALAMAIAMALALAMALAMAMATVGHPIRGPCQGPGPSPRGMGWGRTIVNIDPISCFVDQVLFERVKSSVNQSSLL